MRKLKYHEKKILKKVDFVNWKHNVKEVAIMRRYNVTRQEYQSYLKLSLEIRQIAQSIIDLKDEATRTRLADLLTSKLESMGLIHTKRIKKCLTIDVKAFCRRRLPVVIVQSAMFQGPLSTAVKYIEHGHVRVGPKTVRDPAAFVTPDQEDYITWDEKFKRKIEEYRGEHDDYSE
jgi:U3 small nucleolar ribonucleoprotein protein IMP3